jgi:hypothetical protein
MSWLHLIVSCFTMLFIFALLTSTILHIFFKINSSIAFFIYVAIFYLEDIFPWLNVKFEKKGGKKIFCDFIATLSVIIILDVIIKVGILLVTKNNNLLLYLQSVGLMQGLFFLILIMIIISWFLEDFLKYFF